MTVEIQAYSTENNIEDNLDQSTSEQPVSPDQSYTVCRFENMHNLSCADSHYWAERSCVVIQFLDRRSHHKLAADRWLIGRCTSHFCETLPEIGGYVPVGNREYIDGEFPASAHSGLTKVVYYETYASSDARWLLSMTKQTIIEVLIVGLALVWAFTSFSQGFSLIKHWQERPSTSNTTTWSDHYADRTTTDNH